MVFYSLTEKREERSKAHYDLLYPLAGLLLFALLYAAVFLASGSNPVTAAASYGQNQNTISPTTLGNNFSWLLNVMFAYPRSSNPFAPFLDPQTFPFGIIILFTLGGTAVGLMRKDRNLLLLSLLLWGVILYLFFGTVTLGSYNFIVIISRYFLLVSVPLAVLASYALCGISEAAAKRLKSRPLYFELALLALIVLTNLPLYSTLYNYNLSISGDVTAFSSLVNYLNVNHVSGDLRVFISASNESGEVTMLRLVSGYNRNFSLSPLDFSSRGNLTRWASKECSPGSRAHIW